MATNMVRTTLSLGHVDFLLAQGQDLGALRSEIEAAVHAGGRFVEFVIVGNRAVSALMTGQEPVRFTVETVAYDERDNGDLDFPLGGFFDEV